MNGLSPRRTIRYGYLVLLALLGAAATPFASAVELSGSARTWFGATDIGDSEISESDQDFILNLRQEITPWLSLFGSMRYESFRSRFTLEPTFERTSDEPLIGLAYSRPGFDARLSFQDRSVRSSDRSQELDIRQFLAGFDWRPSRGPRYSMRYRDTTSVSDPAVFGRESEARFLDFNVLHNGDTWSARYSYGFSEVENVATRLRLEQDRHEVRLTWDRDLLADRWSVALDTRFAKVDQVREIPAGSVASTPLPARQGLFAIDPSPDLGELTSSPGLIDGDTGTATDPPIDIGGAATFRNIGVDLGITRPVTELEISVDRPSGATLVWRVYESPDNLNWFQVLGVQSTFDAGFLHYRLRFPETSNRYFKAVNVSVNAINEVRVTELRALLAGGPSGRAEGSGDEYWIDLSTQIRPHDRVEITVSANLRTDRDLRSARIGRDLEETGLLGEVRTRLTDHLELRLGYLYSELEEKVDPVLTRQEEQTSAALQWRPLTTVDVILSATQRDERDGAILIGSSSELSLRAVTELLPGLRITSEVGHGRSEDRAFGFEQTSSYLIESVQAQPNERWLLSGGFSYYSYDSTGTITIRSRSSTQLRTTWFAAPYLSLTGDWQYGRDDRGDTLSQRYSVQWAPGERLSMSLAHQSTEARGRVGVESTTGDASYRLNRWLSVWAGALVSKTGLEAAETAETSSYRAGVNVVF